MDLEMKWRWATGDLSVAVQMGDWAVPAQSIGYWFPCIEGLSCTKRLHAIIIYIAVIFLKISMVSFVNHLDAVGR
jgi:hypothetical protein